MHANQTLQARSANQPVAARPKSALQACDDHSRAVAHLARMQRMADAGATDVAQLYAKKTVSGQDGFFVPAMKSAIHCHVGKKMRQPHLKIRGDKYYFCRDWDADRIRVAYQALIGDPGNAALAGYEDCREYLCEVLGIAYEAPEGMDAGAGAGAAAAGGGSKKKGKSGGKKKK